jgi:protein AFG1
VYFHPLNDTNRLEVSKIFHSLASANPADPLIQDRAIQVWGRTLRVPESTSRIARFTFEGLCGKPLSAADYLEVTKTFGTIFLLDVPKMGLDKKDMARRFITFIDGSCTSHHCSTVADAFVCGFPACYESKVHRTISGVLNNAKT